MATMPKELPDENDVDVDAEARLRTVTLGMKAQADELLLAGQQDKALQLYRELLMHLTRSQVTLLRERELVISCRMNVLAALSKARQWSKVVAEGTEALAVFAELQEAQERQGVSVEEETEKLVLARAYYFRGFAHMQLGSLAPAQLDFKRAMELNPDDETVQNDWKELESALQAEGRVKQYLASSMKFFQTGSYQSAVEACMSALRESQLLKKTELTGLIHGNLAAIYVKTKDDAKAIEHYKRTMLLTRGGSNPTTAQNERVFDILDSLAGCYSRKRDYSSALSVVEDQIKMFPLCPERKDREATVYLNGGRICYTTGKFAQAEEHLEKGYSVAQKMSNQVDVELNCAYWLSKAYAKNGNLEKSMTTLDVAISTSDKEVEAGNCVGLLEKLIVARLDLLDPVMTGCSLFEGPEREGQIWTALEYFEGKREICGHLRAAETIVNVLQTRGEFKSAKSQEKLLRALQVVDYVNIGKLASSEALIYMRLALCRVDRFSRSSTGQQESKGLLVRILRGLELPGGANPSCRHKLQSVALRKLVDVCASDDGEEPNDEVRAFLEEAVRVFRDNLPDTSVSRDSFRVLLPKIARWKASRGDIVGAGEVLELSVKLLRGDPNTASERLCEVLIGLCVVQVRLGMLEEAMTVMKEIEALPTDIQPKEVSVIKDRLHIAVAEAQKKKQREVKKTKTEKSFLLERQRSVLGSKGVSFFCGISREWCARWCGALLACVAAIAVCLVCG